MFTFNQLTMFKTVAETGSFNKAAGAEYVTTNAVLRQINNLEEDLEVQLLNRTNKGVELTEVGAIFYEEVLKILASCEETVEKVRAAAMASSSPIRILVSDWQEKSPAGFVYAKNPSKNIKRFIELVGKAL